MFAGHRNQIPRWRMMGLGMNPLGIPFPITINFDGDETQFFNGGWNESGGDVTNDQIVLGSELLINGDFTNWTGDNPDNWAVGGEVGADPEVSEVGPGQGHGGAGNGLANFFSSVAQEPRLRQSIMTIDDWYQIAIDIDTLISGTMRVLDNAAGFTRTYNSTGSKSQTGKAANATLQLRSISIGNDITIDNVSVKLITFTSLLNVLKSQFGLADGFFIEVVINAIAMDAQVGFIWNYDGGNNFGMIYMDSNADRLRAWKDVAGTYTSLANVAQVATPGQTLRLNNPTGTNVLDILYNGVSKATPTIADAGIISNTGIALFSTNIANTISQVTIGLL